MGGSGATADTSTPTWVRVMGGLVLAVPLGGWLATCIVRLASSAGQGWRQVAYEAGLGWLIGAFLFITGSGHLFLPEPNARSIGWLPSPFQWEVGVASLGIGLAGALAPSQPRPFQLATLVVFATFLLGAAAGHVRDMVKARNFSPGNTGAIFWYDLLVPLLLLYLYLTTD